jgi:TusE/DsrC/DsvC family sulfur relay protein
MTKKTIAGISVDVSDEGYLIDASQWTEEIAKAIAREEGIEKLSESHWKIIRFLQREFKENGQLPTIRKIKKTGSIPIKELYELFPDGPLKKASRIAGLTKPESCI